MFYWVSYKGVRLVLIIVKFIVLNISSVYKSVLVYSSHQHHQVIIANPNTQNLLGFWLVKYLVQKQLISIRTSNIHSNSPLLTPSY